MLTCLWVYPRTALTTLLQESLWSREDPGRDTSFSSPVDGRLFFYSCDGIKSAFLCFVLSAYLFVSLLLAAILWEQLWYCLSWRLFCLQACEKLEDWTSVGKREILTWIIVKRGIYLSKIMLFGKLNLNLNFCCTYWKHSLNPFKPFDLYPAFESL